MIGKVLAAGLAIALAVVSAHAIFLTRILQARHHDSRLKELDLAREM